MDLYTKTHGTMFQSHSEEFLCLQSEYNKQLEALGSEGKIGIEQFTVSQTDTSAAQKVQLENAIDIKVRT